MGEMNQAEQTKSALGEPLKRKLGDVEFDFYPMDVTALVDLFDIFERISSDKELKKPENIILLINLIKRFLKENMPELDDKTIGRVCMKYFKELQDILIEIHMPILLGENKKDPEEMKEAFKKANPHLYQNESKHPTLEKPIIQPQESTKSV